MKKLIVVVCALLVVLGLGYLSFKRINSTRSSSNNILFSIDQESMAIPEFEEFLKVAEEKSGIVNPKRAKIRKVKQHYYYRFWQHHAILAWNKKHKINQLPEYQQNLKQIQEWLKKHPHEIITDRKDILENRLKCMFFIECWWRDIDNNYFLQNFPLFKPYIEKKQFSFDQFGALQGQMILALNDELKTVENIDYLKRNNIKGIDHLINIIKHPELLPKKYEYSITNSLGQNVKVIIYGVDQEILSEIFMDAMDANEPLNKHEIPLNFKNEEHIKIGAQKIVVQAVDKQNKIVQEQTLPLSDKQKQGNFQIFIHTPEINHKPPNKGLVFNAFVL